MGSFDTSKAHQLIDGVPYTGHRKLTWRGFNDSPPDEPPVVTRQIGGLESGICVMCGSSGLQELLRLAGGRLALACAS